MSRVYISTYRRPELLQRCVASLLPCGLPLTILMPTDEVDDVEIVSPNVEVIALPLDHCGVWWSRWVAGEDAIRRGLATFVLTDDDCEFRQVDALALMLRSLDEHAELGAVTRKSSWPLAHPHSTDPALGLNGKLGIVWAQRTSAYLEVGGIDRELPRIGDYDLWLRLRIAGWEIAEHRGAVVRHDNYQPGGLSAIEGAAATRRGREAAAAVARQAAGQRIAAKFPDLVRFREEDGFVALLPGRLAEWQRDYAAGDLALTAGGCVYPRTSAIRQSEVNLVPQDGGHDA